MSRTENQIVNKRKITTIVASFFLLIASFILTGFLPQYLQSLDTDSIEFSEAFEDESQGEEKEKEKETEKETDKYSSELASAILLNAKGLQNPDGHFHKWLNPSADIITPPPEFI